MEEEKRWKPIKGYEDYYEVSSDGFVRSIDRVIIQKTGRFHHRKSKVLKPVSNKNVAFLQVMLHNHTKYKLVYIHRLVAEAFVENPYNLDYVTHLDNNPLNNNAENLRWISKSWKKNKELGLI